MSDYYKIISYLSHKVCVSKFLTLVIIRFFREKQKKLHSSLYQKHQGIRYFL